MIKALIRNPGETILSTSNIDGIDWTNGAPLTNPAWCGGAYALCEDCPVSDPEPQDFDITEVQIPDTTAPAEEEEAEAPTITRLVAVFNTARYEARKAQEVGEADPAPIEAPVAEESASGEPPATIVVDGIEYVRQ